MAVLLVRPRFHFTSVMTFACPTTNLYSHCDMTTEIGQKMEWIHKNSYVLTQK